MVRIILLIIGFSFSSVGAFAQVCTTLGQTPQTAFPVCGTTTFTQSTVPFCTNATVVVPGCEGTANYTDKNPYYYKFTCFQSGTLSFVIQPLASQEDYDWQLYDVTGLPPTAIFNTASAIVAGNWAGTYGPTGASASGVIGIQCSSDPNDNRPTFARSPNLIEGHNYILMVSHYSDNPNGYNLSFGGGTAVITDPKEPHLANARAVCDGTVMYVKLNKPMKCSSIAANGSDFTINTGVTNIISASGIGCSSAFDTDSLMLTLSNPLPPGNYILSVQTGSDANTLVDNCDRQIPVGENRDIVVFPVFPTPMDSVITPGCSPQTIEVVFPKPIRCNSISSDGSNFNITGPYPVTIIGASGNCGPSGLSNTITIQLAAPMQVAGTFTLTVNTSLIDECGQSSPVGDSDAFTVKDTVNADFNYLPLLLGCKADTINYSHNGSNGVNSWQWTFDNSTTSIQQSVQKIYTTFGLKQTKLIVSNGVCKDTSSVNIMLDNYMKAGLRGPDFVCPLDQAVFSDITAGNNITAWNWDFGNGNSSSEQVPQAQTYTVRPDKYTVIVTLITTNNIGCTDTVKKEVLVINNCYIAVPSAFTPNGDGTNDYLYPLNAYKAKDLTFSVFNRFGQRIFSTNNWLAKWDGTFKGQGADPGTYVWMLSYTNSDTGKRIEQKGTTVLIR